MALIQSLTSSQRLVLECGDESVAFIVCTEAGMPAASKSLPYVAGWADGDPKVLADTAERVITAARAITDALTADGEGCRGVS